MLMFQDEANYHELSKSEEIIRRRHIVFSLKDMGFIDASTARNSIASGITLPQEKYLYRSNCASISVYYPEDPKKLVDDKDRRDRLANEVAKQYIDAKFDANILDLKVSDVKVTFDEGGFALDITANATLEEKLN